MKSIAFIDTEVSTEDNKSYDFGAIDNSGKQLHTGVPHEFFSFIENKDFICGHNIVDHDAKHTVIPEKAKLIDTLYLSPLLFPNRPYHALLKDDKLLTDELNNPLNDSQKAMDLFYDEVNAFNELDDELKQIYYMLLKDEPHFSGFWSYVGFSAKDDLETLILIHFDGKICENAPISDFIRNSPVELSYCLALISATERYSLIPRWVQMNYPKVDNIIRRLRNTHCHNCAYCNEALDPHRYLRKYFGYTDFRKYNGEPLQENAVDCAIEHESLLAIFPTGGGKSLTFQIPALISGETERGLTVVISPLQSLMKDQVDTLEKKGIEDAVTINGLLSPIEHAEAIERVESGLASILYISPESLRSVTIERLLLSRHIDRFVIDEAHCFSAWGQDFRVDYLYIGDFIKELQEKKGANCRIPVSCFTATAKQKVVSDIKDYFRNKLGIELNLFTTDASRTNLRYAVLYKENDNDKYEALRDLIETKKCPTIIYVSRTRRTYEIDIASDENKRKLYVAFTRAKSKLCVHYSGTAFDKYKDCATDFSVDEKEYSRPTDITLQLSYKDVYLDFFKDKKQLILKLKSGTELEVEGRRLYCNYCGKKYPVAQFSRDCSNRIQSITQKGYSIKSARIRYIVAWKGENDERETAIILPDVDLKLD